MVYPNLKFPKRLGRPSFYTNFVQTIDGKVAVLKNPKDYWPIGSKKDYKVLLELRSYADCLVHGKNLSTLFGEITLKNLNNSEFKNQRTKMGKTSDLPYYIVTNQPKGFKFTNPSCFVVKGDLKKLSYDLYKKGYQNVLVEGGPTLLASFLKEGLLDEIFLTISPKIFGNKNSSTLTLVEGYLFPKTSIKELTLLSVKRIGNELFLRYRIEK